MANWVRLNGVGTSEGRTQNHEPEGREGAQKHQLSNDTQGGDGEDLEQQRLSNDAESEASFGNTWEAKLRHWKT